MRTQISEAQLCVYIYMENEKYLSMFNHSVSTPFDVIYGYYYTMYDFSFTHNVVSYTHIFYIYLIKRINIHTHRCVLMCVILK